MSEELKISTNDWLFNSGLVGFINILDKADKAYEIKNNFLKINIDVLGGFENDFFNYFMDKYEKFTVYGKIIEYEPILESYINKVDKLEKKDVDNLNKIIDYTKPKLKRNSYKAAYPYINNELDILAIEKDLKKIRLRKNQEALDISQEFQEQVDILLRIINYMKDKEVRKYILAKWTYVNIVDTFSRTIFMQSF